MSVYRSWVQTQRHHDIKGQPARVGPLTVQADPSLQHPGMEFPKTSGRPNGARRANPRSAPVRVGPQNRCLGATPTNRPSVGRNPQIRRPSPDHPFSGPASELNSETQGRGRPTLIRPGHWGVCPTLQSGKVAKVLPTLMKLVKIIYKCGNNMTCCVCEVIKS